MGKDLRLLPIRHPNLVATERLSLDRHYELYSVIQALGPKVFDCPIDNFEDDGIKKRTDDDYGASLTFLTSKEFKKLKSVMKACPFSYMSDWNKAIIDLCAALPEEHPIILWWH